MSDIGTEFIAIKDVLRDRHMAYIGKFGNASTRHIGNDALVMSTILAKLKLLAKALVASGAIDEVDEQAVRAKTDDFPMSLRLGKKGTLRSVYLLNDGENVIVSGSVGLAEGIKTISGKIAIVTDDDKVCKQFPGVLSVNFNWKTFAIFVLDAIHEVIYSKHDVARESFLDDSSDNVGG